MAASTPSLINSIRFRIERYPAKMVKGLASTLLDRYAGRCDRLLDPFCGSGELLVAASARGIRATGIDVNPFAILLSAVRTRGFEWSRAAILLRDLLRTAERKGKTLPLDLLGKDYWFTVRSLEKLERMRYVARMMRLHESPEGQSVLLALALSIRLCSKADDRSPKPFISKEALTRKFGQHLDPAFLVYLLHLEIQRLYGTRKRSNVNVQLRDMTERMTHVPQRIYSHVITSPPYLNAQDYYRNFKLELAFLSKLTETPTPRSEQFIGTERGPLMARVTLMDVEQNKALLPQLEDLERKSPRHAEIVHRYLADMRTAIIRLQKSMVNDGSLVIVCGDNLVCRTRINTWRVLNRLIESNGFTLFDSFDDPIRARALAPSRAGHKGLIKEERISAFRLVRPH